MGEELSRVEDLLATGVEEPVEPMSRVEAILRGEDIKPLSRVEDLLKNCNPPDYEYIDLSVTENGTYTPPSGKMYKKAVVDVPSQAPVLAGLYATENGTYTPPTDADGFGRVDVDVQATPTPLEDLSVVNNGVFNPPAGTGYRTVTVNVPTKDLDKVTLTQAEYNQLTTVQKEDPTKIYFIHKQAYNWYYNTDRSLAVREKISDNSFRWYISNFKIDGFMPVPNNLSSFILNSVGANGFMEGYTANPNATIGFYDNTIRAWSVGLSSNIYGTVDSCIIESTDPALDGNEPYHEWEEPDFDPYVMEPYLYYMDSKYETEVPIELESDNTPITTSTSSVTLEAGYHYLFTTIYSFGGFNNETVKEGGSSRVFNTDGYDRVMYIVSTGSANVTYSRYGSIDSNKYIKFRIKKNGEYADDFVFKNTSAVDTAFEVSTSPTLNLEAGKYYMISYKASLAPNLTGATPICYAYLGETDAKKSISMIIRADSDTVVINDYNTSYSYFYYQKLLT